MSEAFHDRDIISITDFSRDEILHLCAAGSAMAHVSDGSRTYSRLALLSGRMYIATGTFIYAM